MTVAFGTMAGEIGMTVEEAQRGVRRESLGVWITAGALMVIAFVGASLVRSEGVPRE